MKRLTLSVLFALASVALPLAQSGGDYIVYVGSYTNPNPTTTSASKGIYAWRFDSKTGALTPIGLAGETINPAHVWGSPDGRFLYAVRVDTSQGFELCPADQCQVDVSAACPAAAPAEKFRILPQFASPLTARYEAFLAANDIGVAGIEFIVDAEGRAFTYDVNTNTNYNPDAERRDGRSGMATIARYLTDLLAATAHAPPLAAD